MLTASPLGLVVAVADFGDPLKVCVRLLNVTVAAALLMTSDPLAVPV